MINLTNIENINTIRILDDNLYFVNNNLFKLYKFDNDNEFVEVVFTDFKINKIFKVKNLIIVTDQSNTGYKLLAEKIEKIEDFSLDSICEVSGIAVSTKWISYEPVLIRNYLYDIVNSKLLWEINSPNLRFDKNLLFSLNSNGFKVYSSTYNNLELEFLMPNSKYNWSAFNYKNELMDHQAEIKRIIGVYKNIVWITLNSGRLLGIEMTQGSIKFDTLEINRYIGKKPLFSHYDPEVVASKDWSLYLLQYTQLDEKNGVLFGLRNYYYFEIDLTDPANRYVIYDASDSFLQFKIEADMANGYEWTWCENEIYFGRNFTEFNNLGVFNRLTKTVTWATRLEQDNGQARNISKIEYGSGTLYVLDQLKTLHIFKNQ